MSWSSDEGSPDLASPTRVGRNAAKCSMPMNAATSKRIKVVRGASPMSMDLAGSMPSPGLQDSEDEAELKLLQEQVGMLAQQQQQVSRVSPGLPSDSGGVRSGSVAGSVGVGRGLFASGSDDGSVGVTSRSSRAGSGYSAGAPVVAGPWEPVSRFPPLTPPPGAALDALKVGKPARAAATQDELRRWHNLQSVRAPLLAGGANARLSGEEASASGGGAHVWRTGGGCGETRRCGCVFGCVLILALVGAFLVWFLACRWHHARNSCHDYTHSY